MRFRTAGLLLACAAATAQAQTAPAFAVASVKPSARSVGRDYRGRIDIRPAGVGARNVSLEALLCAAWRVEPSQVSGPGWLDNDEFDIDAKTDAPATDDQVRQMLRALLTDRFHLATRTDTKEIHAYALLVGSRGPKIHPDAEGQTPPPARPGQFPFHGEMREFANLLGVQLSIPARGDADPTRPAIAASKPIPVVDRTGLSGVYTFAVDFRLDGSDPFTLWQRILGEQLGLRLERQTVQAPFLIVERAERTPTAN